MNKIYYGKYLSIGLLLIVILFTCNSCGRAIKQFNPNAPVVTTLYPANKTQGIATDTYISARFDKQLDPTSITNSSILVSSPAGGLTGSVTYDAVSQSVIFYPTYLLSFSTTYTVSLSTLIKDLEGNSLEDPISWTFTTASH